MSAIAPRMAVLTRLATVLAPVRVAVRLGQQWSWQPEARVLTVNAEDLQHQSDDVCTAITLHEVGHVLWTRYRVQDRAPPTSSLYLPDGAWALAMNVLEDPRVEAGIAAWLPGARAWLAQLRQGRYEEPKSAFAGFVRAHLWEWQQCQVAGQWGQAVVVNPALAGALQQTRAARQAYAANVPARSASEAQVLATAKACEKLAEAEIVPAMAALWAADAQDPLAKAERDQLAASNGFGPPTLGQVWLGQVLEALAQEAQGRMPGATPQAHQFPDQPDPLRDIWDAPEPGQDVPLPGNPQVLRVALARRLQAIFVPEQRRAWQRRQTDGTKLDMRQCVASAAAPVPSDQVWMRRAAVAKPSVAVTLLVDLSGSMEGGKAAAAELAVGAVAGALVDLGVPHEVLGFQVEVVELHPFGARPHRGPWQLQQWVRGEMPLSRPGRNDDAPCLRRAADRLLRRPERTKLLVVVSDGQPHGHGSSASDLHEVVQDVTRQGIALVGLGIGKGTAGVREYYPQGQAEIGPERLADVVAEVVRRALVAAAR